METYYVYIVTCADRTLYTGIAVDLKARLHEHNVGALGAKYTRSRRPVYLSYSKEYLDRASASREEYRIKQLSKQGKIQLIKQKPKKGE